MKVADNSSRSKQEKSKKLLFDSLDKKTRYYLNKPSLEDSDLYYYVKDFFREYLDITHELSFEEIKQEIDKTYIKKEIKDSIYKFVNKINVVEYKDSYFDEEKIKSLINEFYDVVKYLHIEEKNKKSFFNLFFKSSDSSEEKPGLVESYNEEHVERFVEQPVEKKEKVVAKIDNKKESSKSDVIIKRDDSLEKNAAKIKPKTTEPYFSDEENANIVKKKKTEDILKNVELSDDFSKDITLNMERGSNEWAEHDDSDSFNIIQSNKRSVVSKEKRKDNIKSKNIGSESINKSSFNNDPPPFEDDIYDLMRNSETENDKEVLVSLYKKINELYEKKGVEEKAKIYPKLLSLYEKITKN